jgi:hypothetical protein
MNANADTHAPGNMQVQLLHVVGAATTGVDVRFDGAAVNFLFANGIYTFNPPLKVNSVELEERDTAGVLSLLLA